MARPLTRAGQTRHRFPTGQVTQPPPFSSCQCKGSPAIIPPVLPLDTTAGDGAARRGGWQCHETGQRLVYSGPGEAARPLCLASCQPNLQPCKAFGELDCWHDSAPGGASHPALAPTRCPPTPKHSASHDSRAPASLPLPRLEERLVARDHPRQAGFVPPGVGSAGSRVPCH